MHMSFFNKVVDKVQIQKRLILKMIIQHLRAKNSDNLTLNF